MASLAEDQVSQAELGRKLGLSAAAITKLKKQGMPVHDVDAARQWRRARLNIAQRKREAGSNVQAPPPAEPTRVWGDETHDEARTRREIAEANLAELKLAELRGELVRRSVVEADAAAVASSLKATLMQLPSRLALVLAEERDSRAVAERLESEMWTVIESVRSGLARF